MKKIVSIFLAVILALSFGLTAFAVTATDANATRDEAKATFDNLVKTKFDVDGSESITAADARATLLSSAGLAVDGADTLKMDTDSDGKITAIDARTILRISAGLDSISTYLSDAEKLDYFNAILNTAIPNGYSLYKNGIEYTANVSYTDPKGVIDTLDSEFSKIDSSVSFKEGFLSAKGEKVYSGNTLMPSTGVAQNRMMIICNSEGVDEDQSSYLTVEDITNVEYKTNQSYTFTRYGTTKNSNNTNVVDPSNVLYSETVTGLDSLTVWLEPDNDITGVHSSKAFLVYDQADVEADVAKIAESFNNMSMEFTALYSMDFKVTPSVGGVKYYNGSITVYFDPADGTIVSAYYSLYTDYTMSLNMDVKIFMLTPLINVDKEGPVNITNTTQSIMEYYFIKNNPNHVDW